MSATATMIQPRHRVFSLARVRAIASNTLLELVRLKVFYFLLLFALVLIGSSAFVVQLSFQEQFQVLKDVSLGAMSIFTWLLAVLATAMLLPKDIEDRTLYTILAKPVPRFEYLLGKFIGVLVLLAVATVLMAAVFALTLYGRQELVAGQLSQEFAGDPQKLKYAVDQLHAATFSWALGAGIVVIYVKAALFAALTLFISTFASSWIFTIMVSVVIYIIGHVQGVARDYWLTTLGAGVLTKIFLGLVSLIFPDLQLFNLIDDIVVGNAIALGMFLKTCGLGVLYVAVYLLVAYIVFAGKEL